MPFYVGVVFKTYSNFFTFQFVLLLSVKSVCFCCCCCCLVSFVKLFALIFLLKKKELFHSQYEFL
jgi:hypothetical protein